MGTEQIGKTIRLAAIEAQRHQAMVDAVMTPELRKVMEEHGKRMSEGLNLQVKVRDLIRSPAVEALMQEQNQRIAEMLNSSGIRQVLAGINFDLPEGIVEQIAAYREQVETEAAAADEDAETSAGGLKRLAEEREAIITCLKRIGAVLEGAKFVPNFPVPAIAIYLFCILVVLAELANERLAVHQEDQ